MSRGIGATQQRVLDTLADETTGVFDPFRAPPVSLTIAGLAERLGRSPRQVRTAVAALERRGLVATTRQPGQGRAGWRGYGEYGRLERRGTNDDRPTARLVRAGERWPFRRARRSEVDVRTWTARTDVEFVAAGMPVSMLHVWLAENRRTYRISEIGFTLENMQRNGGPRTRRDYQRITALAAELELLRAQSTANQETR